jgi:hypothetical protein
MSESGSLGWRSSLDSFRQRDSVLETAWDLVETLERSDKWALSDQVGQKEMPRSDGRKGKGRKGGKARGTNDSDAHVLDRLDEVRLGVGSSESPQRGPRNEGAHARSGTHGRGRRRGWLSGESERKRREGLLSLDPMSQVWMESMDN